MKTLIKASIILAALAAGTKSYAQVGIGTTSPLSTLDVRGSTAFNTRTVTATTTLTSTDHTVVFTGSSAATLTLPSASACVGREIWIKNSSATNPSPVITLATVSSQTIDGNSSWTLSNSYEAILISSDGTNWIVKQQVVPSATALTWKQNGNSLSSSKTIGTIGSYDLPIITNNTERMRITTAGKVGVGTTSPSYDWSFDGTAAKTIGVERNTTSNTAGNSLTLQAGGAYSGGTNLNGGDLIVTAGTSTGTGTSNIYLKTSAAGSSGTADNTPTSQVTILGSGNVGIGTTSPTNPLHVYASSNPLRIEGLQTSSSVADKVLVADATGVVKTAIASSSNVAGYLNADLTTSGTSINKITMQTELYDAASEYNNSTGYFVPTVTGTYQFEIEVTVSNSSANSSDYGTSTDKSLIGLVNNSTSAFVAYHTYENAVDPRSYFFKGVVSLTAGTSYYFGIKTSTGSTVINYYPTGATGSGIGTYFNITRIN